MLLCSLSPVSVACVPVHLPGSYRWRVVSIPPASSLLLCPSSGHLKSVTNESWGVRGEEEWGWWCCESYCGGVVCPNRTIEMRDSLCLWKSVFQMRNETFPKCMCLFFLRCSFCPALKVMSQVLHLSQNVAISSYTSYHLVIYHRPCACVGVVSIFTIDRVPVWAWSVYSP